MSRPRVLLLFPLFSSIALAQSASTASTVPALAQKPNEPVTLPIVLTRSVSAETSHAGDPVFARTTQRVQLANGAVIPPGATVSGYVLQAVPFVYDRTPYAKQRPGTLTIQFDSIAVKGSSVPLQVTIRAMADPLSSWGARTPNQSAGDSSIETMTQVGGDQLTRAQSEVVSPHGDVVAYNRHGGVYAHLIASRECDASSTEVSVGIFSASACGLYGYGEVTAEDRGSLANPSKLTLSSTRYSPKIWKNSTALLETLPLQPGSNRTRAEVAIAGHGGAAGQ